MIKAILLNMFLFAIFDMIWWGFLAKKFFLREMSHLARMKGNETDIYFPSAALVYVLMSVLLAVFVTESSMVTSGMAAAGFGALLGLGLFATFDFTNHALLAKYPIRFAIVDVSWGTFMCAVVAGITYWSLH